MIWHLLVHAVKEVRIAVTDRRLKNVRCEKCQTEYFYVLNRSALGLGFYFIIGGNKNAAKTRAHASARRKLEKKLTCEAELVRCPQCQWANDAIVGQFRRQRFGRWTIAAWIFVAVACIAVLVGYLITRDLARTAAEALMSGAYVAVFFALCAASSIVLRTLLRWSINPNRNGRIPIGTPSTFLLADDAQNGEARLEMVES